MKLKPDQVVFGLLLIYAGLFATGAVTVVRWVMRTVK